MLSGGNKEYRVMCIVEYYLLEFVKGKYYFFIFYEYIVIRGNSVYICMDICI